MKSKRIVVAIMTVMALSCGVDESAALAVSSGPEACREENWGKLVKIDGYADISNSSTFNHKFMNLTLSGVQFRVPYGSGRNRMVKFPDKLRTSDVKYRTRSGDVIEGTERLAVVARVRGEKYKWNNESHCYLEPVLIDLAR